MSESDEGAHESWKLQDATTSVDRFIRGLAMPEQTKPEGLGASYSFPTNAADLTSVALGSLQLQITSWYTYLLGIIGKEDAETSAMESTYDIALGFAMDALQQARDKKVLKEALRALAIKESDKLTRLTHVLTERRMRLRRLEAQSEIYHEQVLRLSREQSRRESETRI